MAVNNLPHNKCRVFYRLTTGIKSWLGSIAHHQLLECHSMLLIYISEDQFMFVPCGV
jgi:hypothetical protein